MTRKAGRPRAEILTRERILTAALQLVDEHGVDTFSMRKLAAELGVDPMAIYNHLPNKQAVLAGLVEKVFEEITIEAAESWQEQVLNFARAYYGLTRAHPNLVFHIVSDVELISGAALDANEYLYRALASAGLSPLNILHAANLIVDYLNGYALAARSPRFNQSQTFPNLDPFPTMQRVFSSVDADNNDVETGLNILLAGIESMIE